MAESSILWTTGALGDGLNPYTMGQVAQTWMRAMFLRNMNTQGVCFSYLNDLAITNPANQDLTVDTGAAVVAGFPYFNTAAVTKTVTIPIVNITGWRLILRASWAAQTVRITLLESADGVAAIPGKTQNDGVTWDINLAYGTCDLAGVLTLVDNREYLMYNIRLNATANGRTSMQTGWFDTAAVLDKFAESSFTTANLQWLIPDGAFTAAAATRALFGAGIWTATEIADRTRTLWVPCIAAYNTTDGTALTAANYITRAGWEFIDNKAISGYGQFQVPTDFVSTMTITPYIISAGAGNVYSAGEAYSGAENEAYNTHTDTAAAAAVAITGGSLFENAHAALALAAAAAGDFVNLTFTRNSANALDTRNGPCNFMGWKVSYTADS